MRSSRLLIRTMLRNVRNVPVLFTPEALRLIGEPYCQIMINIGFQQPPWPFAQEVMKL